MKRHCISLTGNSSNMQILLQLRATGLRNPNNTPTPTSLIRVITKTNGGRKSELKTHAFLSQNKKRVCFGLDRAEPSRAVVGLLPIH